MGNIEKHSKAKYAVIVRIIIFLVIMWSMCTSNIEVVAAQGSVVYGYQNYNYFVEDRCAIGVYVNSDVALSSYEICLEYDESMLAYLDGASEKVDNRLYLRDTGTDSSFRVVLHFQALKPGTTSIGTISANCISATDVSGNLVQEPVEIAQLTSATINISSKISSHLSEITVADEILNGFSSDILTYDLTVEPDIYSLDLDYIKEDSRASVEVSKTYLTVGSNTVELTVKGSDSEPTVYTIHVTRKKEEVAAPIETKPPIETKETQEASAPQEITAYIEPPTSTEADVPSDLYVSAESENGGYDIITVFLDMISSQSILWGGVLFVFILLLFSIIKRFRIKKQPPVKRGAITGSSSGTEPGQSVIKVKGVSMCFRIAQDEASSLKEYLIRGIKGKNHYTLLTALKQVSFEVKQGDVIGIIGTNGSGKSTLLKIISGVLPPTKGSVSVDRSKVQLLTLGTGFDMELTARENVYLNGAIIGYNKEFIDEKYEEIVRFAELEGFMDERMKNFSSGMVSRLGFAIATIRETPEILILDEVLSVGDIFFRKKSGKRISEMMHGGATVLIVSHSVDTILKNCNRVLWIEKGVLRMDGDPQDVCTAYQNMWVSEQG